MESKEFSWAWVTADRLLSHGACELLFALLTSSASAGSATIYDGESTSGDKIVTLEAGAAVSRHFNPAKPVYCRRGLYVDVDTNVTGVFVQWRELGHKEG